MVIKQSSDSPGLPRQPVGSERSETKKSVRSAELRVEPVRWFKGRGAVGNPQGRFEKFERQAETSDWLPDAESGEQLARRTEVRTESARSIISRNQSEDIFFDQSINPYRGCEHGCIYCYARPQHSYLGLSPGQDFETILFAKTNAAEKLREELAAPGYQCSPINIGAVTDPYQPVEKTWRLTRAVLEVLGEHGHPYTVITKSALVERDIDLIAASAAKSLAAVYVSVTTLDPTLASRWEPRASAPWRRIETIRRLAEAGVPVGVMVAPIVPFLNDADIENILLQAAQAGARSAHYTVLRLPHELKQVFIDWLRFHYPDRAQRVLARLMDLRGGARLNESAYFTRMKGVGAWSELIKMRFEMATRKAGLGRDRLPLRTDLFVKPEKDGQMNLFGAP